MMGMSRGGGGGIQAAIQRGRQQRGGGRPGSPIMPQRVPGAGGGMIDTSGGYNWRGNVPPPQGGGPRMAQQQQLAQQMRRGANPGGRGAPNPTGNRMQMRRGMGGGGRRY